MIRVTTTILSIIGLTLILAPGCADPENPVVPPEQNGVGVNCTDPVPGKVGVEFDDQVSFADVDAVVQSLGLTHTYRGRGEASIRAAVESGDGSELRDRVAAEPTVENVYLMHQTYPVERPVLAIHFIPDVPLEDARALIESFTDLEITNEWRNPIYVEFDVPVGEEDAWINRFLQEDSVINSGYVPVPCPLFN